MKKIKCGIFISDEGYGHMVRQRAIIHELLKKSRSIEITVFNQNQLLYLKETFGKRIKYVSVFNNILTKKKSDGSLDLTNTRKMLKLWKRNNLKWKKKVEKYFRQFNFIISDSVPEAFELSNKYNIPAYNVSHYTWDWFFEKVCKSNKKDLIEMNKNLSKCTKFFFPPYTPREILKKYSNKIKNVNFIIGDFKRKLNKKRIFKKCLIMDNGTKTLSKLIDKTVPHLNKIKELDFYLSIDNLNNRSKKIIIESENILPTSGLKAMHEKFNEIDMVIARGGFNTLSECLVLKKPAIFFEEKNNPEIKENLKMVSENDKLADIIYYKSWKKNFKKTINTFLQKKAKKIYNKLEKINFKSTGEKQVVNEIMKDLRKTI